MGKKEEIIGKLKKIQEQKEVIQENVTEGLPYPDKFGINDENISLEAIVKCIEEFNIDTYTKYGFNKVETLKNGKNDLVDDIQNRVEIPKLLKSKTTNLYILQIEHGRVNTKMDLVDVKWSLVKSNGSIETDNRKYKFTTTEKGYRLDIPVPPTDAGDKLKLDFYFLYRDDIIYTREIPVITKFYDKSEVFLFGNYITKINPSMYGGEGYLTAQYRFDSGYMVMHYHLKDGELKNPRYMYFADESGNIIFVRDLNEDINPFPFSYNTNQLKGNKSKKIGNRISPNISAICNHLGSESLIRPNFYTNTYPVYMNPGFIFFSDTLYTEGTSMNTIPDTDRSDFFKYNYKDPINDTTYDYAKTGYPLYHSKVSKYDKLKVLPHKIRTEEVVFDGKTYNIPRIDFKPVVKYYSDMKLGMLGMKCVCGSNTLPTGDVGGISEYEDDIIYSPFVGSIDPDAELYSTYVRHYAVNANFNGQGKDFLRQIPPGGAGSNHPWVSKYGITDRYNVNTLGKSFNQLYRVLVLYIPELFLNNKNTIKNGFSYMTLHTQGNNVTYPEMQTLLLQVKTGAEIRFDSDPAINKNLLYYLPMFLALDLLEENGPYKYKISFTALIFKLRTDKWNALFTNK